MGTVHDTVVATIGCNDWFGNDVGNVGGRAPDPDDFELYPEFCNLAEDDVRLALTSPLFNPLGCGRVGALGGGCAVATATQLLLFAAERGADGVRVRWQVGDVPTLAAFWLERAESSHGPWTRIDAARSFEGDIVVEWDREAPVDRAVWYRLMTLDNGALEEVGHPIEVHEVGALAGLSVTPNPSRGPLEVTFGLAERGHVDIDLLDVQGRSVARLAEGEWPAGRHVVRWNGARGARHLPAGVYLVRLRSVDDQSIRRIVLWK